MKRKVGTHKRNTEAMHESPRCGAATRIGTTCNAPAVRGKKRCRMHGGAYGSGAQPGNSNAYRHGLYTRENVERRRENYALYRAVQDSLGELD